jgi:hypothetical protein
VLFSKKKNVIEEYKGNEAQSRKEFLKDAERKAKKGYVPVSENYTPGKYGVGAFILALLLCLVLIGILVFIYMLIVKPAGTLTVTYELKDTSNERTCPKCAETIKVAAVVCRFCGHDIVNA